MTAPSKAKQLKSLQRKRSVLVRDLHTTKYRMRTSTSSPKTRPGIPWDEYEDGEPDMATCRECKLEWEEFWIEENGLCPLCY